VIPKITISELEYDGLIAKRKFLDALEAAGVDNWEGYSIAWRKIYGDNYDD
jgi:hypothetical protein